MAEGWFSAAELAALQITGLPATERSINRVALRDGWQSRERNKRGGGREYAVAALPAPARAALAKRQVASVAAVVDGVGCQQPAVNELKDHQRKRMEARASILALIDHLVEIEGHTRSKAIEAVVERAKNQALPPLLQNQIAIANARANGERTLTRATLFNWMKARDAAGGAIAALAPAAAPEADMPGWAGTFMQLYARPSKPNLTEVLDGWPAGDIARPSYDQARRFLKRLDAITRNKGRMGPRALKGLRAYIARDVANLWPGAVFIGDGHTFKAEVAHPLHGRPFRPEVTAILDVYTRRWVGWSVALAENTWSVADALRHAVTTTTCCDVFYYDNGAGAKNAAWDEPITGFAARLSITKLHSAPWSSQARGVIERFNSSVFHKLARALPTYIGQRMDMEARQAAFKITRRDIAQAGGGSSKLLMAWDEFRAMLESAQRVYNATPHSFLPRVLMASGRRQHQTPDAAWEAAVAAGWMPEPVPPGEARDLFRPAVTRSVQRGVIKLFNNAYFHPALEAVHGENVQVAFDLHDATRVVVRLMDGRFVCEAEWNANSRDYVPVTFAERAREKRLEGRLRRLDEHRDEALAEAAPNLKLVAHAAAEPPALTARQLEIEAEIAAELEAPPPAPLDPDQEKDQRFRRALDLERQAAAGEGLAETDAAWLARYVNTPEYRTRKLMLESFGDSFLSA
ncbi:MAG TPA: Mu transposase C-terminal domain-containing protein [Stellaceae bacterium]|jgi:putative transposase